MIKAFTQFHPSKQKNRTKGINDISLERIKILINIKEH